MKFSGREEELKLLEEKYRSRKSELLVIYGRRRVGKSALVEHFLQSKKLVYRFEGLENEKNSVCVVALHFTTSGGLTLQLVA